MGILMSKTDAGKLAAALRGVVNGVQGPAMVRVGREPRRGLVVDVIHPPFGTDPDGRYETVMELPDPTPYLDDDEPRTVGE